MKSLHILIGTRPNFIKITQFKKWGKAYGIEVKFIHTGQHFDVNMADVFFQELGIQPDYFLNIPPATPELQMAEILVGLHNLYQGIAKPDIFMVPGDVNSTLAGAIFANKTGIPLAHLEAGLRSFDKTMPEEHNRILTDNISEYLMVTEQSGLDNIKNEQIKGKAFFVGNTMIDTMVAFEHEIKASPILDKLQIRRQFIPVTIHRPANVDNEVGLTKLLTLFQLFSIKYDLLFPVHPRTLKNMNAFGLKDKFEQINGLRFLPPLGYFAFQKIVKNAAFVLTDSGGIQEETTFLQIPCLTLRPNTERPSTCEIGTNTLIDFEVEEIMKFVSQIEAGTYKKGQIPILWDGNATERIMQYLMDL